MDIKNDQHELAVKESDTLNLIKLDKDTLDTAQRIIDENNIDKVKDLTHLFNLNVAKKNVVRVIKMNSLLDRVTDQMVERVDKRPYEFSNTDLVNYMKVVQASIDKANEDLNAVDESPAINVAIDNRSVNVNMDSFDRDSKERMIDAVRAIMKRADEIKDQDVGCTVTKEDDKEVTEDGR